MATLTAQRVTEAGTAQRSGPGRVLLTIITAGEGSSGSYTGDVLESAAADKVFPRGTQMHINHSTEVERMERPEGDLRNMVGVLLEDARMKDGKLVAEARISSAWKPFVEEFGEFIGASISAQAEIGAGRVVERLLPSPFNRVDLVTVAGRGGEISEVLESARAIESRSVVIDEAISQDVSMYLSQAIGDAYVTPETWAHYLDHDEEHVYFYVSGPATEGSTFRQAYTLDGVNITLDGTPQEVRRSTSYVPVGDSVVEETKNSEADPVEEKQGKEVVDMSTTEIKESELAELRESAGRVEALEAELTEARTKLDESAKTERRNTVESLVAEAFDGIEAKRVQASIVAEALAAEQDDETVTATAKEAAAEIAALNGAGTVHGVGSVTEGGDAPKHTIKDAADVLNGKVA